jgi:Mesyanzhinovviridae DNA primase
MIDIKPNLAEAVAFAVSLPTDQMHLCAIHPAGNRPVVGRTFPKTGSGQAAALRWLTEADRKGYGIYFNANEVKPLGKGHAKAKEAEVSTVRFLHVDADLPAGTAPDAVETARADLLAKIKAAPLVPSLIINSGNGFGLFWELTEPVTVTDENRDYLKSLNIALADQLGGDDCENLDRVMRLPFTVNRPNAKKTKAGRVPVLADIVTDLRGPVVYALEEFVPAAVSNEMITTLTKSSGTAFQTIGSPDIPETVDLSTLDEGIRSIIENGPPTGYAKSRSEAVYNCACDLRRIGWSDGDILFVLTNETNGIADHIFDQKQREPLEQASRVIMDMNRRKIAQVFGDASEDFGDDEVEEFTAPPGPLTEFREQLAGFRYCLDPPSFIRRADKKMISEKSFNGRYAPLVNRIPKLEARYKDNAPKLAISQSVLERIDGTCYRPGEPDVCGNLLNMWQDPKIEPLPDMPSIFLAHMDYLIPDQRERELALNWLAWCVQKPSEKQMFALLIVDDGGTGKGWIGYMLRVLFGDQNVAMIESDDPVKDMFNGWTLNRQLAFIHEFVPDRRVDLASRLKGLITEAHIWVNEKFIARFRAENRTNLFCCSNHRDVLKIARRDRRWLVVQGTSDPFGVDDNGETTKKTTRYYERLFGCLGTPEVPGDEVRRIKGWLMTRNLSEYNGKGLAPQTEMKVEVADNQHTDIEQTVLEAHRDRTGPFVGTLCTAADVVNKLELSFQDNQQGLAMVSKAMREAGCRTLDGTNRQIRVDGKQVRLWAVSKKLAAKYSAMEPAALAEVYRQQKTCEPIILDDYDPAS